MMNNPPPTLSTTHDDRLSALEEFTKEFTNIKESVEALSNAIA